jgi:hypothetical protein
MWKAFVMSTLQKSDYLDGESGTNYECRNVMDKAMEGEEQWKVGTSNTEAEVAKGVRRYR